MGHSTDGGHHFTFDGPWDDVNGFAPDFVHLDDGRLRVFYNDTPAAGESHSRVSADGGQTWTDEPGARLANLYGEAPTVVHAPDGGWFMYCHRFKTGEEMRFQEGQLSAVSRAPGG